MSEREREIESVFMQMYMIVDHFLILSSINSRALEEKVHCEPAVESV